ncbi:hypothetical protein [Bacillus sp. 166amftsu]|uniref:hypothetical protein n=1 Tax=Bacillus sp. 166amftsu TaxID=1761753 RepID=UPI000B844CFC|nr:hypothetical protein [Bacillus sp. 166amftsu]
MEYGISLLLESIGLGGSAGIILLVQVEQPNSLFLVCSAWRKLKTPFIESEKRRTLKSFEKVNISVVVLLQSLKKA